MNARLSNARGLSLIEVTIMLLVLMLLTSVLAPSIMDYVKDAQWVKVKEDCEAIGVSVVRLTRDIGPCLKFVGTGACTTANRVDILYSDGPDVTAAALSEDATTSFQSAGNIATSMTWSNDTDRGDSMEHQFTDNTAGYLSPANFGDYSAAGPMFGLGWRGAYLSAPIGPDPWGHRYLVNSVFLSVANDATPGTGEGQRSGGWSNDSFCVSAGPNGLMQTALGGHAAYGVARRGDDFLFIISGDTR